MTNHCGGQVNCDNGLIEALNNVASISIPPLKDGYSETIGEFYDDIIEPLLPDLDVVRSWQSLLYAYADDPDAIFFLRKYQSAPRKDWAAIRRGFLTEYDRGGYVCCDNFFAHYIFALAMNDAVPTLAQFKDAILSRRFPYGFMSTKEERELQAYAEGKVPRISSSGWKLAHLVPVNGEYRSIAASSFVGAHFPRGNREEWQLTSQGYYSRRICRPMTSNERSFLTSHFIRLASPINYFLVPKQANERDACGNNIGENRHVLEYVAMKFRERYGDALGDFAYVADVPDELIAGQDTSSFPARVVYRSGKRAFDCFQSKASTLGINDKPQGRDNVVAGANRVSRAQLYEMVRLYLEQGISFRNLERRVLGINSQTRGGGFVAKKALNDFGITASCKGMLATLTPEAAVKISTGMLKEAICEVYKIQA
ncbi:MAG: hypothetical protein IKZ36_03740 [Kiritimatiellae bacterium]|nr:hypothetical protein [Kiritimatiellia bacterium]